MCEQSVTEQRLESQITWYNRKSEVNKRWFYVLKAVEIVVAATIPLLSCRENFSSLVGAAGLVIVIMEGFQQLFQFQKNWMEYRSTCESLKHEKYLWLAKSGPYEGVKNPESVLAERIEGLISREHSKWFTRQKDVSNVRK